MDRFNFGVNLNRKWGKTDPVVHEIYQSVISKIHVYPENLQEKLEYFQSFSQNDYKFINEKILRRIK